MNRLIRIMLVAAFALTQCVGAKAAIGSTTVWRIRVGGNNANGGGYNSAISGAGTDYTDQDAAQLTVTDIVTIGGTTVTSVTGGFTSQMIGNCLRIVGDNYYFITAVASSNSITVDRNTGTAIGQTGSVGGAFASLNNFWIGGSIAQPSITSPLAPGHIVYMRGSGSNDPVADDYTYPATDYSFIPNGDSTTGKIQIIGYNGRPRINSSGLMFYQCTYITIKNLVFMINSSPTYPQYGLFNPNPGSTPKNYAENVKVDTNGIANAIGLSVTTAINCVITNSGTTSASGGIGLYLQGYQGGAHGCTIEKQRGIGISMNTAISNIVGTLVINNAGNGIVDPSSNYGNSMLFNTIYGNGGNGIDIVDSTTLSSDMVYNNIIANNGGYGISVGGTLAVNDKVKMVVDYNDYYMNSSGAYNGVSAGAHDVTLDPQFTNAAGGDFSVGTNLKDIGFPSLITGSATTSFIDIGAAQRASGGATATTGFTFAQ